MYLVSACLAGLDCRYDGRNSLNEAIRALLNSGRALPVCPEQLGGAATPRQCCEIVVDESGRKKVLAKDGTDITNIYSLGAERTVAICKAIGIQKAILKSKSPSCGSGSVYDGTFSGKLTPGDGFTAALLKANGIHVLSDEEYMESLK